MLRELAHALTPRRWRPPALPQALIIGAQKGGTTALAAYLGQHPRLACSTEKEVSFFGSNLRYGYGLPWYVQQWPRDERAGVMRFEASPLYMVAGESAPRIREVLPKVKLIAILRDPVYRAYSAWQMYRRQLAEDPQFYRRLIAAHFTPKEDAALVRRSPAELEDFGLAVRREVEYIERGEQMEWSVVELGLYGGQLRRYAELFPSSQLLVLDSDELRFRRAETLNRVLHFLGLRPWDWSRANLSEVFVGHWAGNVPARTRDFLREYYVPSNRLLAGLMPVLPAWAQEARYAAA